MEIVVQDTLSLLRPLFTARIRPKALLARAQEPLFGPDGLRGWMRVPMARKEAGGYAVMQAAQQDGYDVLMAQQMWGLFDPERKPEASAWAFDRLLAVDALGRARSWLRAAAAMLPAPRDLARLTCILVPADPVNRNLMVLNHGLSVFGGVPGYVVAEVWPSEGNLTRLHAALARAVAHNMRWAFAPVPGDRAVTLGDLLVLEGLGAAVVAAACPDHAGAPWLVVGQPADDWPAALAAVAGLYGAAAYDEIGFNVYGARFSSGPPPPEARPLDAEERAYARDVIGPALATSAPGLVAAYLYGDALVSPQGHRTMGLPPYAGVEVGYHLVQAYLRGSGRTVAEAVRVPTTEIIATAAFFA